MLKKDPHVPTIYDALFLEYMRQHRVQDAENVLKRKVDNNPKAPDVYLQLAAHYYSQKDRPKMQATLSRLTSNQKDFPAAYKYVGDFYLRVKDIDLALENYRKGIEAQPKRKSTAIKSASSKR